MAVTKASQNGSHSLLSTNLKLRQVTGTAPASLRRADSYACWRLSGDGLAWSPYAHVMRDTGMAESASTGPDAQRRKSSGAWAGYLVFALFMLFLLVYDAQAAYQHEWANFAGITLFTLLLLTIPTGAAKRVRRVLRDRAR